MISLRLGNIYELEILHFCHGNCCCPISLILFLFSCKYLLHDGHVICIIPNIVMQDCIVKQFTMSCPIALMNRAAGGEIFKEPDGDFTIGRTIGPMTPGILVLYSKHNKVLLGQIASISDVRIYGTVTDFLFNKAI